MAVGFYSIIAYKLNFSPQSTAKGIRNSVGQKMDFFSIIKSKVIDPIITRIAPLIRIEDYKQRQLSVKLKRAEIDMSPQMYYAQAIVMATLTLIIGGILSSFILPQMMAVISYLP